MNEVLAFQTDFDPDAVGVMAGVVLTGAGLVALLYPPVRRSIGNVILHLVMMRE